MVEDIKKFLENFVSSWQVARIYEFDHPKVIESINLTFEYLQNVLFKKSDLVIGIVGEELTSGEDIFFDLSKRTTLFIRNLKDRGIEKIIFNKNVSKNELINFLSFLRSNKNVDISKQYLLELGVKNITVGRITVSSSDKNVYQPKYKYEIVEYQRCLSSLNESIDDLINNDVFDFVKFKVIANDVMESLIGNYEVFSKLGQSKGHDITTFMHLLNVSILSVSFSNNLGYSMEDCLAIGTAGLFHDIGKIYISRNIIQKKGSLDNAEFDKIKSHTVLGAQILMRHVDNLTILPVVVAFEHHIGDDLTGYPKLFYSRKPHIASLIISICDVYDALTQRRSYKQDYPSEMIYEIMLKNRGNKFPEGLFDKFFSGIGVWPKGTIVILEDNRIGIVREINPDDIFNPKVEIFSDNISEMIDLSKFNNIKIKRSLNPFTEGKKYIDLI